MLLNGIDILYSDELLDMFRKAQYFSILDLASGYWQVAMDPNDQAKTAFITS